MADNAPVDNGPLGTIPPRSIDKGGVLTQVMALDLGGAGAENLLSGSLPVSITPSTTSSVTETSVNVTTSNSTILASNTSRTAGWLMNISDTLIYISFGATATTSKIPVYPQGTLALKCGDKVYTGAVNAIHASSGNKAVFIQWC
jgi:hypothetical protein